MSKTVLEMARETGYIVYDGHSGVDIIFDEKGIGRFVYLIREDERRAIYVELDKTDSAVDEVLAEYEAAMQKALVALIYEARLTTKGQEAIVALREVLNLDQDDSHIGVPV